MNDRVWGVVGAQGMLGRDLVAGLRDRGEQVRAWSRAQLDIVTGDVEAAVRGCTTVVNCAAYTAVDDAEGDESAAYAVNATGPARLAQACAAVGAQLVHVSTDYVFDGSASEPYDEATPVSPLSAYGRTKAAGEEAVLKTADALVVRTAWAYGEHGNSFPATIARIARERGAVSVVNDQYGQPTWTVDVARVIMDLGVARAPGGIYHATSSGFASWCDFAQEVVATLPLDVTVTPVAASEFPRPAPRPQWSVLGHQALIEAGVAPIPDWRERWAKARHAILT